MVKKYESKLHKFIRLGVPVLVGASLIGGISYVALVRPIQISNEKKQFEKARLSIEELYTKLEATIGKPDQIKRENYCSYTSAVYGKGARSCDVVIIFLYESKDLSFANSILKSATIAVGAPYRESGGRKNIEEFQAQEKTVFYQNFGPNNINCGIDYTYPVEANNLSSFPVTKSSSLQVNISCGGPAKAEHYPIKTF